MPQPMTDLRLLRQNRLNTFITLVPAKTCKPFFYSFNPAYMKLFFWFITPEKKTKLARGYVYSDFAAGFMCFRDCFER